MKNDRNLTRTAMILVESGAIYSIFLISLLVTFIIGDFSVYVPFFLVSPPFPTGSIEFLSTGPLPMANAVAPNHSEWMT